MWPTNTNQVKRRRATRLLIGLLATAVVSQTVADSGTAPVPAGMQLTTTSTVVTGLTAAHRSAELAPLPPGQITTSHVTEGQTVKKGDLLIVLDDGTQAVRTAIARLKAESTFYVDLARTVFDQSRKDADHVTRLSSFDSASEKEINTARSDMEARRLKWEIAKLEHEQARLELRYQEQLLEQLHIRAPFDGYVSAVHKKLGESVDEREPVLTVVQLDPLEVTMDCPLPLANRFGVGKRFVVEPVDQDWGNRVGTVTLVNRVADAASQTIRVKLAVPNGDGAWIAGLKVCVDLDRPATETTTTRPADVRELATADPTRTNRTASIETTKK